MQSFERRRPFGAEIHLIRMSSTVELDSEPKIFNNSDIIIFDQALSRFQASPGSKNMITHH